MSDPTPNEGQPLDPPAEAGTSPGVAPDDPGDAVVDDTPGPLSLPLPALLVAVAVVPAVVVGLAVWFIAGSGGGGTAGRVTSNVTNVVNAFSQGQSGSVTTRFEGTLAPGFPKNVPLYPGARLISSELQISGADADYLVVYDTTDARQKVADYFSGKLNADPWQIDASQDGRDSSLRQFSNVGDANVHGLVLTAESKQNNLTTIIVSVQITSGATAVPKQPFSPGTSRPLPAGLPASIPVYPGATVVSSAYQKASGSHSFAISLVTKDSATKVLDYYRLELAAHKLTPSDGDASQSTLAGAKAIDFTDAAKTVGGQVIVGALAADATYVQVDINATTKP
ncbi:MAG TPA: hypothetical protein VEZ14_05055 [Dehalococcoidia bacterium]|nr:hypothetical protein [Dehalococcoidia bacterium]